MYLKFRNQGFKMLLLFGTTYTPEEFFTNENYQINKENSTGAIPFLKTYRVS